MILLLLQLLDQGSTSAPALVPLSLYLELTKFYVFMMQCITFHQSAVLKVALFSCIVANDKGASSYFYLRLKFNRVLKCRTSAPHRSLVTMILTSYLAGAFD